MYLWNLLLVVSRMDLPRPLLLLSLPIHLQTLRFKINSVNLLSVSSTILPSRTTTQRILTSALLLRGELLLPVTTSVTLLSNRNHHRISNSTLLYLQTIPLLNLILLYRQNGASRQLTETQITLACKISNKTMKPLHVSLLSLHLLLSPNLHLNRSLISSLNLLTVNLIRSPNLTLAITRIVLR